MSVCRARSLSLFGIDAVPVEVEVDVSAGLPGFSIVGLPDAAVQEARERVRVAISNNGYKFPTKKVIVNLAPANLRKEGAAFDLPIALAILAVSGAMPAEALEGAGVVGVRSRWPKARSGRVFHVWCCLRRTRPRPPPSVGSRSTGYAPCAKRWTFSAVTRWCRRQRPPALAVTVP